MSGWETSEIRRAQNEWNLCREKERCLHPRGRSAPASDLALTVTAAQLSRCIERHMSCHKRKATLGDSFWLLSAQLGGEMCTKPLVPERNGRFSKTNRQAPCPGRRLEWSGSAAPLQLGSAAHLCGSSHPAPQRTERSEGRFLKIFQIRVAAPMSTQTRFRKQFVT